MAAFLLTPLLTKQRLVVIVILGFIFIIKS